MAMSQRRGGYPTPIVYQSFQPNSEWKKEDGAVVLIVYLPGFLKERIRFTKDKSSRCVRVNGERVLGSNRRLRVNTAYAIPENCNLDDIETHFLPGVLAIKFPTTITAPRPESVTTQEPPSSPPDPAETPKEPLPVADDAEANNTPTQTLSTQSQKGTAETAMTKNDENIKIYEAEEESKKDEEKSTIAKTAEKQTLSETVSIDQKDEECQPIKRTSTDDEYASDTSENDQSFVNMFVAVLVIMGLGAYIFRNPFGSFGKC
ncbi:hypothetical protein K2173_024123 [Erythroxylum novogranatense]|uniref:SHSP domain-containing protein n=1 Tax=Erythroxylum novogranatense TaxID=1862640 RepID=A0AAV8UGV8_9ROSI|nr:hypothetical protein K2173_024123 [Erythroxylum novogranatense]